MRLVVSFLILFLAVLDIANAAVVKAGNAPRAMENKKSDKKGTKTVPNIAAANSTSLPDASLDANTCAQAGILAQGIALNIADQKQEQAHLDTIVKILAQNPVDQKAFADAKDNLVTFVKMGISIREANQKLAPENNPALDGLGIVADAQTKELDLANSLTGDPTKDKATTDTLANDFKGGIQQNQKNMAAATQGCDGKNQGNGY